MTRRERITEALRREISIIIHDELKDPRLGFVTVTRVELTPDYRYARVFFSVFGKEEDHKKTKEALDSALGFIRKLIAQRIRLRFAPEVVFKEDRSTEYSVRIHEILEEIKELNEPRSYSEGRVGVKIRKEGRRESRKGHRLHKKTQ